MAGPSLEGTACYSPRAILAVRPLVDVVIVSYNSAGTLRGCVEPLAGIDWLNVIVVDNASSDDSLASIADLDATLVAREENGGFAVGCNAGWRRGSAPAVLFLNPDAKIEPSSIERLATVLEREPKVGLVAPRVLAPDGTLDFSQRRFPRHRSTFAQALFLHRVFPGAKWTDEMVRDPRAYETSHATEWIAGVCVMVGREALERIDGWSEAFFMYGEDKDLCRRLWGAGYEVRFIADAEVVHIGGASRPRDQLLPTLAASTIRYAQIHEGWASAAVTRTGVALGAVTHALLTTRGRGARVGHARALATALSVRRPAVPATGEADGQALEESGAPSLNGGRQAG